MNALPVHGTPGGGLDTEGPVVDTPALAGELKVRLDDGIFIGHHLWQHARVDGAQGSSVPVETQGPCKDVRNSFLAASSGRGVAAVAVGVGRVAREKRWG